MLLIAPLLALLLLGGLPAAAAASSPPPLSPAGTPGCAPLDPRLADALFGHWAELVQSGDAEAVADLYAPDALLLPTLSSRSRNSHPAIADYFNGFAARHPQAEVVERTLYPACNQLVDAGLYRFRFAEEPSDQPRLQSLLQPLKVRPGAGTVLEARYTLVYGFNGEQWQLLHHHSSLVPSSAPIGSVDP